MIMVDTEHKTVPHHQPFYRALLWTCIFALGMGCVVFCPRISKAEGSVSQSVLIAMTFAFVFALSMLFWRMRSKQEGNTALIDLRVRRPHIVQTCAQSIVYVGWCLTWKTAWLHLPLLFAQVMFAYLIDMGLSWRRYPCYRLGLSPVPIVLSTNLFLFFTDAVFGWQWVLIGGALASREIFRWQRGGRDVHIFNPSAIALSLGVLILIYTENMHLSWGEAIARTHALGTYSYDFIFVAGLVVASMFTVGFTIVSAVCITLIIGEIYFIQTGVYRYLDTGIPAAVFLGMNLLVTDPVSSPWRRDAKVIYGILYGVSVFILYGVLRTLERPPTTDDVGLTAAFCDKLLAVPLLNLSARFLDRSMTFVMGDQDKGLTHRILGWENRLNAKIKLLGRSLFVLFWVSLFIAWVRPSLVEHPGRRVAFWKQACEGTSPEVRHPFACENRNRLYLRACEGGSLPACHNLALALEKRDPLQAAKYYKASCDLGQLESCNHLGGLLFTEGERTENKVLIDEAQTVLAKACTAGLYESCTRQAMLLRSKWIDRSQWTLSDWERVWDLLDQSCRANEPYACMELSRYTLPPPQIMDRDCRSGDQLACVTMIRAQRLEREAVEAGHPPQSFELHPVRQLVRTQLSTACQADMQIACVNLGWMLWRGDGGVRDQARGSALISRACSQGFKPACERSDWIKSQLQVLPEAPP